MDGPVPAVCRAGPRVCGLERSRVLVAERDPLVALCEAEILRGAGCEVEAAHDGLEALARSEADPRFDLLVTGLRLPRLDGAGLVRRVRRRHPWRPVLVVTGAPPAAGAAALQGEGEGPLFLLAKPAPSAVLMACAARAVCRAARPWVGECPVAAALGPRCDAPGRGRETRPRHGAGRAGGPWPTVF